MEQHDRERLDSVIAAVNDLTVRVNGMVQADIVELEETIDYVALEEGIKAVRSYANLLTGRVEETLTALSRLGTRLEVLENQVTVVPQHSHDAHTHVEHAHREHTHTDILGQVHEDHRDVTQLREDLRMAWQSLAKINERISTAEVGWRELINAHAATAHLSAEHDHDDLRSAIIDLTHVAETLAESVVEGQRNQQAKVQEAIDTLRLELSTQLNQTQVAWNKDLDELAQITADKTHTHEIDPENPSYTRHIHTWVIRDRRENSIAYVCDVPGCGAKQLLEVP